MKFSVIPNLLFLWLLNCKFTKCSKRPIIGILVQEFTPHDEFIDDKNETAGFVSASYVKAVECSGAKVVPIFIRQNHSYYERIMNSINGIVLPGGNASVTPGFPYYDASATIFKIAQQMNDKGISFPIFGVCLGFQAMLNIHNNNTDLLMQCDSIHETNNLEFVPDHTTTHLFSRFDREALLNLELLSITLNNHVFCIFPHNFTTSNLAKEWRMTSLSTTGKGLKFIASAEHVKYPFIGVQFHPEIAPFNEEFEILHDREAVRVNRYFYDALVEMSTNNDNKFQNEEEERKHLIYNYNPIYRRAKPDQYYAQKYIFYN
ncbi:gamma-glutamyl hydrolase-like [Planococcus citri]|uniref:gamma-glutamyl hydrolase-like n=1 Tax=Planococcus citri TaxID=170843 RepID=UPI0031F7B76A